MTEQIIKEKLEADILKLKTSEGYLNAGFPHYDALFGRDSLISAWELLDADPSVARSTLKILSQYQGKGLDPLAEEEPGRILHEYRFKKEKQAELPDWRFPYYGSVDAAPLYIFLAREYYERTRDAELVKSIWPNIKAAYLWLTTYADKDGDGFIEYERQNPKGLLHQGWRDAMDDHIKVTAPVAIVEAQGYAYAAYLSFSFIARAVGEDGVLADGALFRAGDLQKKFLQAFWAEDEKYFALALDGKKNQRKAACSNPGHLLFTGILPGEYANAVVKRLFRPDLLTPYGIRTLSDRDPDFSPASYHMGSVWPHDNWIIYQGLKKAGYAEEAAKIKNALVRAYVELGGVIPELFAVLADGTLGKLHERPDGKASSNPLQAWACGGLYSMLAERESGKTAASV